MNVLGGCVTAPPAGRARSPALTAVLYDLSRQIPQLKKDIQDGLLKMLSLVLMHKPLRHPGMPKGLAHQLASPSLTNIPEASDVGSITLALRTLGSFEFEGEGAEPGYGLGAGALTPLTGVSALA